VSIDRDKWLAERRLGIGGSDVAPILGLSPWATPLDVYLDKIGEAPPVEDTPAMAWGRALEPVIRQAYEAQTGAAVRVLPHSLVHPRHEFMRANLDGVVVGMDRVFEAKTARSGDGWGEPGTAEVPDAYALQVQHYLLVAELSLADIAVLIGGNDFRVYTVEADPQVQSDLIDLEREFWQRVQDRNPPEPRTFSEVQQRFGRSEAAGVVTADSAAAYAYQQLLVARRALKGAEQAEQEAKAVLMKALGDSGDTLIDTQGRTLATWKLAKAPQRFDAAALKTDHPDIYQQYMRAGEPSRRFLPKEIAA
jgi:putative phage-type endonuclease